MRDSVGTINSTRRTCLVYTCLRYPAHPDAKHLLTDTNEGSDPPYRGELRVIERRAPTTHFAGCRAGEGLTSSRRHYPNVPHPIRRGVLQRLHIQVFSAFHGLRPDFGGSALPAPAQADGPLTTPQASHNAADRSVAPPLRAFDTGLRRQAFPPDAASLLPGLLAATRTGLPPAGDDELMSDQIKSIDHLRRWAHSVSLCNWS